MYTIDGQSVEVVKKIEDGYLAKMVYESYSEDSEDYEEVVSDQVLYFPNLFDKPVIEKYADEVKKLKAQETELALSIDRLQAAKRSEEGLLNKISKFPFIAALVGYVTGEYEFILHLNSLKVVKKSSYYASPNVKVMNLKSSGWQMAVLSSDYYDSDRDDTPFLPFMTMEDLNAYAKDFMIKKIGSFTSKDYNNSRGLEEWHRNISDSCTVKNDPSVLAYLKSKLSEMKSTEAIRDKERINKEIEEKKKQLEKLTQLT